MLAELGVSSDACAAVLVGGHACAGPVSAHVVLTGMVIGCAGLVLSLGFVYAIFAGLDKLF